MIDFAAARQLMVECQVRTNKVTDPAIIAAMEEIPRERFVGRDLQGVAYLDEDLPLGNGRYLIEPMVLARMLQTVEIKPSDVVLDIGGATGYSAAVIARLASTVIAIEPEPAVVQATTDILTELSIDNVAVVEQDMASGYPAQAPYDVILFQGSVADVPDQIVDQLADGGRLCAVIADGSEPGRATLMLRRGGNVSQRVIFDANIPPLPGFEKAPSFVF